MTNTVSYTSGIIEKEKELLARLVRLYPMLALELVRKLEVAPEPKQ